MLQPSVLSQHSCLFPLLCQARMASVDCDAEVKGGWSAGAQPELSWSLSAAAAPELQPHSNPAMFSPGHHEPSQPGQQLQPDQERRRAI